MSTYSNPAIAKYGKVVRLPNASQQPHDGSGIVVDVTKGGEPDKLNPAIEKVCRFVNIYAGVGKGPAKVDIAVVLHGDATLTILNAESYSAFPSSRFGLLVKTTKSWGPLGGGPLVASPASGSSGDIAVPVEQVSTRIWK